MIDRLNFLFEQVSTPQLPLVKKFYKSANYFSQVGKKDEVYILRDISEGNKIIAAARLVKTADYLILRSMVVSPDRQRQGLGQYFLEQIKPHLSQRNCWCFPFEWLKSYYASVGFEDIPPEQAPTLIRHKFTQYTEQGRKILIMGYP